MIDFKRGVGVAFGSVVTLTAIMAAPVLADTESAIATNEESILDSAAWSDKAAANVQSYANVRSQASVESEQAGVLLPGHAAEILENDGTWSKIRSGNVEGYVRNDLLVFGEEARVHYMNVCGFTGTVTAQALRVRADASMESEIVTVSENGSKLSVTADQGDWYQVTVDGQDAYVSAQYLELDQLDSVAMTGEEYQAQLEAEKKAREEAAAAKAAAAAKKTDESNSAVRETSSSAGSVKTGKGELDLLAALIQCEAGGESRTGKVAVGAVVLNRVNSGSFPDSISDVVYQGGQFSPVTNGSLSRALSNGARSDCYEAAQAALNGENPVGGSLYFNSGSGKGIQIGNQHFY